jgi:dipeptidyl-peptidase-3
MKYAISALALAVALVGCDRQADSASSAAAPAAAVSGADIKAQIDSDLHRHIAELSSDAYEGREPGTAGEDKTVAYLAREFEALGLEPANNGEWFQPVPISSVTSSSDAVLSLSGTGFDAQLAYGTDMMASTQRQVAQVGVEDSPLVFVGYGINAPERDWNDYADVDVAGKTVVVLINDPGFATQDESLFNGNTMTYYGRWDYKYAEAARQGAAAVIIVHETAPAAYPWEVVASSWSGANIGLTADNKHADKVAVEAWIPLNRAEELFTAAGLNYAEQKAAAAKPGFKAVPLADISASIALENTVTTAQSRNVAALIPGSEHPEEVIIYTAHWDHLGVRPEQEGDNIYNGASDNASGTAALFALARMFKNQPEAPKRSIMFLAVTAEESGLLGSKWYGENPIFPPAKTVANFNMDNIAAGNIGLTRDVAVVGMGNSELENYLAEAVAAQGREVVQEPYPEKGYYYRSDHFSLAKVGIPALYLTRSTDSVEHGKEWGSDRLKEYTANHYHKPSDEYDASWNLSGAVQEVQLLHAMGARLAANRDFPNWHEGAEFKGVRDASLAADFQYKVDRFADIQVLAYRVPGFEDLSLQQKTLLYYLYQAAYAGRDIMWDQNYKHNLRIRRTLEAIVRHYEGDRSADEFEQFMVYARQVWFSNGIHHHYSTLKHQPGFSADYFAELVNAVAASGDLPVREGEDAAALIAELSPVLFDPSVAPKKVNTAADVDKVASSAVNFYEGVTEQEVRDFYAAKADKNDPMPISYGLNSKLVKNANGELEERVWKVGGMYGAAIEQVVFWLEKAVTVAENDKQRKAFELLIKYYKSGDLKDFDDYSVAWVEDTDSRIDVINGFIEVYNDPIAYRGSFESVVSFRDEETTKRIAAIGDKAQWFEDNSPIMDAHKRKDVKGILGKAITVVAESGDASPSTPIGINLPNANWIRANHGSKSVSLSNIVGAYDAVPSKAIEEFAWDEAEIERARKYNEIAGALHTDMHEVIGHASGKINPGVGTPKETLKQYSSTSEEGRADLVALYYLMDPKLVELGVMPSLDVGRVEYDRYIRNGIMTQLQRIKPGELIEEAHMRNRAMVARWAYEQGKADKVIERRVRDGKTYFVVNDYEALRELFGQLLRELQRIKSEGDFDAIQQLVENYGTQVDAELHAEVLERYAALDVAPYKGFVNPLLRPVVENGEIVDVIVEYPTNFVEQMLYYADNYSFLPTEN